MTLKDFAYMPLDVVRLRDADVTCIATGDEFRAAVLLWCASWHQQPAASLPNDDRVLSNMAGFGRDVESWKRVKDMALRGFVECSDGRLYHPVIAEKAIESWNKKKAQRDRTAAATAARNHSAQRDANRDVQRNVDQVKVSKGKVSKGISKSASRKIPLPQDFTLSPRVNAWAVNNGHSHIAKRLEHFIGYAKRSGKTYADWDEAFMSAVREDWAKLNGDNRGKQKPADILAQSVAHAFQPLPNPGLQD